LKPGSLQPMLPVNQPLQAEGGYVHEIKWDGFRALAYLNGAEVYLASRNGHRLNERFPQIAAELAARNWRAVLDGELVAVGDRGEVDFSLLRSSSTVKEVRYVVFDLLVWEDSMLCPRPWRERRDILEVLFVQERRLLLSPLLPGTLQECLELAKERGWEGIISKHEASPYLPGVRSSWWRKHKIRRTIDGVVVGIRCRGQAVRSLALGLILPGGKLCYVGNVGSGLRERDREFLQEASSLLRVEHPGVVNPPSQDGNWVWFRPHLVAEVEYLELTPQLRLRHPVFLRFRFDKRPEECSAAGERG